MADWADNHKTMVLLGVADESELKSWASFLRESNAKFEWFVEPDRGGEATALAVAPGDDGCAFRNLKLL